MHASTRDLTRLGVALAVTSAVMCADPEAAVDVDITSHDGDVGEDATEGPSGQIRYHLDWDWGDAEPTEDGWRVLTDRGYEVRVTDGYLVTYSVQLAPCTDDDLGQHSGLRQLFGVGRAWAGHGGPEDPSAWLSGIAEPLATPESVSLEPITVSSGIYCRAHYLIARAETKARGLPEDVNLVGVSLIVAGSASKDGDEPQPFSVFSSLPMGQLMAWSDPVSPIDLAERDVDVTVTRDLGGLFDGVEFDTTSAETLEKTVLLGLANKVRVHIE